MKRKGIAAIAIALVFSLFMSISCFAGALSDFQAAQAQVAALAAQIQQVQPLAQTNPTYAAQLQTLQAQLLQAQQLMAALQPAAVQELQQQQKDPVPHDVHDLQPDE